jgi:hypothetical protein
MAMRESGSMGTSTRKRLEGLIHAANNGGGGGKAAGGSGGGSGAGLGPAATFSGSWGKAATGRGDRCARPQHSLSCPSCSNTLRKQRRPCPAPSQSAHARLGPRPPQALLGGRSGGLPGRQGRQALRGRRGGGLWGRACAGGQAQPAAAAGRGPAPAQLPGRRLQSLGHAAAARLLCLP